MVDFLALIVLAFLCLVAIIDLKVKQIPAVFTTAMIFVAIVLRPENLFFGVLAFVFAVLLKDLDQGRGMADMKVMILIGFMINNIITFAIFMILTVIIGAIYTLLYRKFIIKKGEIPFLPVFFVVYAVLWAIGGIL